jgi:hypothetical protein
MRKQFSLIPLAVVLALGACQHKPAYSDIDPNKTKAQNQNTEGQPTATDANPAESPTPPAAQPSPAAPQRPTLPSFLDQARGGIKDLPTYPRSQRVNVQIAPVQGFNTAVFMFSTPDPIEKVAPFFEQAIKDNHWTVVDRVNDPEYSEWTLEKGKENSAKVRVSKDQNGKMTIMFIRGEKIPEPAK